MRTTMRATMAAIGLGAALLAGCTNSPLSAGKDFTMTLLAQPQAVVINPAVGINTAQSTILATVLNADSVPQSGLTVYFSTKGGSLTSGKNGVKTNAAGIASDVLTIAAADPPECDVTAASASITATVKITKTTVAVNHPPTAAVAASPHDEQASGKQVIFDGSGSTDPDTGDSITMYKWVITSTNGDTDKTNPIVAEGPGVSGVSFPSDLHSAFTNIQELNVTLLITDDPNAPALFQAGTPISYRSQATIPYAIVAVNCSDNKAPTAVIAGAANQEVFGTPLAFVNFLVDGSLSSDPETAIETYTFNCGNGSLPLPGPVPSKAICKYQVDQIARSYTVTLVVTDQGTGRLVNGSYECAAESPAASIQVTVAPLATPGG